MRAAGASNPPSAAGLRARILGTGGPVFGVASRGASREDSIAAVPVGNWEAGIDDRAREERVQMNSTRLFRLLVLQLALIATATAALAQPANQGILPAPESIQTAFVPPINAGLGQALLPYDAIRSAKFEGWRPGRREVLFLTRFGETAQLHASSTPLGMRRQLTFLDDRVVWGRWRPGHADQLLYGADSGGAENFQVYLLDLDSGATRQLSDGHSRTLQAVWSHDGRRLAWASNERNGTDFDIYILNPDDGSDPVRIGERDGLWFPLDWSPDGGKLLVEHYTSINRSSLSVLNVSDGEITPITDPGAEVAYEGGRWSPDAASIYTTSDASGEFREMVRYDFNSGLWTRLSARIPWDVEAFDLSDDGRILAFFSNEDGISRLHLLNAVSGDAIRAPELPDGVAGDLHFRTGSHELGFSLSWARAPGDVYSLDVDNARLERWTESETGGLDSAQFVLPELIHYPTFDTVANGSRRRLPAFVYKPESAGSSEPTPVLIQIHGGPESQFRPRFLGSMNYMIRALGVTVIYPNVRGSAGYGKSYLKLDNGTRREDTIKDIGALLDWIAGQPDLDASRVMVSGGSYGGYMALATMTHYSERLRCGFDYVGISNFVTFLTHTQDYRRDLRRAEYGDERSSQMKQFLESISPLHNVSRITRPLLVAQGANDPRVPATESSQIVDQLAFHKVPVWYVLATNEGHGFAKLANRHYLSAVFYQFALTYLLPESVPNPVSNGVPPQNGEQSSRPSAPGV